MTVEGRIAVSTRRTLSRAIKIETCRRQRKIQAVSMLSPFEFSLQLVDAVAWLIQVPRKHQLARAAFVGGRESFSEC